MIDTTPTYTTAHDVEGCEGMPLMTLASYRRQALALDALTRAFKDSLTPEQRSAYIDLESLRHDHALVRITTAGRVA